MKKRVVRNRLGLTEEEQRARRREKCREYTRRYRERYPERVKASAARETPEQRRAKCRRWKERHPRRAKEVARQSYLRHREKRLAYNRQWGNNNKKRKAELAREWNAKNKWRKAALFTRWYNENRGRYKAIKAKRRAVILKATPSWVDLKAIRRIYERCPAGHEVDHIAPLVHPDFTGLHVPWNLQYLTKFENQSKSNRYG